MKFIEVQALRTKRAGAYGSKQLTRYVAVMSINVNKISSFEPLSDDTTAITFTHTRPITIKERYADFASRLGAE